MDTSTPPAQSPAPKSSSTMTAVALIATVLALLAISIPFIWQADDHAEAPVADAASAPAASRGPDAPAPAASHGDATDDPNAPACDADAAPARLDFNIKDMEGKDVPLSTYKGKIILLNFWATWCGPCKAEIPGFVELQEKYRKDLVVVGYSVDDTAEKARPFIDEYKMNYPVLLGLGREDVQDAYGPIWGIPASFLISKDGKVCKRHMGIAPKETFEREIQKLL